MIVVRAPLRVSLFGGGTDMPAFLQKNKHGAVLSMAIDKYMYIVLNDTPQQHYKISYSKVEQVEDYDDIKHDIVRESLRYFGVEPGIEIGSFADIPTEGSGLGSSSVFSVALLKGLLEKFPWQHRYLDHPQSLAAQAFVIERDECENPVGYQDHLPAAFGSFRKYSFSQLNGERDSYASSFAGNELPTDITSFLLLFHIGGIRSANYILKQQEENIKESDDVYTTLQVMAGHAGRAENFIKANLNDEVGHLLNTAWELKKKIAVVSNEYIDSIYDVAMKNGALGGKLLGAGQGGYMLFYVPYNQQTKLCAELKNSFGIQKTDFKVALNGVEVVYNSKETGK